MNAPDPADLLFGGMEKLGPGDDSYTRDMLRALPRQQFNVVVDAGCGTGRQTLVLARELRTVVHAVDVHEAFLSELKGRAREAGLGPLVRTHCMDMRGIPVEFPAIDLLWAEGAAYNIGFANALTLWASAIPAGGFAVVSELCWLRDPVPDAVKEYFLAGYPDMQSLEANAAICAKAGYEVLATRTLPPEAWVKGYYDVLESRAKSLVSHADPGVRGFAEETLKEIEIFGAAEGIYGYVFYALRRL